MEPKKGLKIDYKSAAEQVRKLSEQYGLQVNPNAKIHDISVGMQQRVEIMKTLYRGAKYTYIRRADRCTYASGNY